MRAHPSRRALGEDAATAEGRLLHERADKPAARAERGVKVLRGLALRSDIHGLTGKADVVELRGGIPFPVEYKRGRPKPHRADEVQLCAQSLCLEEMFGRVVPAGAIFYGQTRRRMDVTFDAELGTLTLDVIARTRAMLASATTPPPVWQERACPRCSLHDLCQPRRLAESSSVASWLSVELARA